MLKPSLQLKLGQQLTMTPQLQQAIRLLQLPALELQAHIRELLESNVMLEPVDDTEATGTFEGVETPAQRRLLTALGCDEVQGYFYSRSVPIEKVPEIIDKWSAENSGSAKAIMAA